MNNLFNTKFEISLRVLLTLEVSSERWQTADMIAATDFITVYSNDFGISDENLHGNNNYKFSEFPLRRELVHKAVKLLVFDGFINVLSTKKGFLYSINRKGVDYCAKFGSDYASAYRHIVKQVRTYIGGKSEREILEIINRHSVFSLQRSETNG